MHAASHALRIPIPKEKRKGYFKRRREEHEERLERDADALKDHIKGVPQAPGIIEEMEKAVQARFRGRELGIDQEKVERFAAMREFLLKNFPDEKQRAAVVNQINAHKSLVAMHKGLEAFAEYVGKREYRRESTLGRLGGWFLSLFRSAKHAGKEYSFYKSPLLPLTVWFEKPNLWKRMMHDRAFSALVGEYSEAVNAWASNKPEGVFKAEKNSWEIVQKGRIAHMAKDNYRKHGSPDWIESPM